MQALIFLAALIFAWFAPQTGNGAIAQIEKWGARVAAKKNLCLLLIAAAAIVIRLALLPILPVPVPQSHDEFSYLLAGDTFAHGRLANPPHPLWIYFDTIHVNQHPAYMSKYPPAQGAVLAVGELLGNPWFGVVLSAALMCCAALWMLQGWLPPQWAFLGGILVLLRVGIFSYWMNGYWGGAVPAIGGALAAGAVPRIMRRPRIHDAILLACGIAILANSRPLEGAVFCLPLIAVLLAWLLGKKSPALRVTLQTFVAPLAAVLILCGLFIGYYNWRGTGSPTLFPYVVNERAYLSTPTIFWEKPRPEIHYTSPELEGFYNVWVRNDWQAGRVNSVLRAARAIGTDAAKIIYFYFWPELCALALALPWLLRDRRIKFLLFLTVFCFAGFLLAPYFQAHYAAPQLAVFFALAAQAMRHLRRWESGKRPVGIGLTRVVFACSVLFAPFHPHAELPKHPPQGIEYRAEFQALLQATPGKQLAIVHYSPRYLSPQNGADVRLDEWVYNGADIDQAKVVWARDIPGVSLQPLLNYFSDRKVWLVEPDADPPRLTQLGGGPPPQ